MRRVLLASGNAHKLRELREILAPFGLALVAPVDVGYEPNVVEDGDTFEANAIKKAQAGLAATGLWTIADDSGIEARALNWEPGVYSARYAGEPCDDDANNQKLVRELAEKTDRYVRYRCVIALARPATAAVTWAGAFPGVHIPNPRGVGGFGYDPYVLIPELNKTVAELSNTDKHARSHRGQAVREFVLWLQSQPAG